MAFEKIRAVPIPKSYLVQINVYAGVPPLVFSFRLPEKRVKNLIKQLKQMHKENV